MANTTSTNALVNETAKEKAFILVLGIVAFTWVTGALSIDTAPQLTEYAMGAILVGMNIYRYLNNVPMSKLTFMVGSFIIANAFLAGATLYNPVIFPLFGLMVAAYGIFNALQSRITS